MRTLAPSNHDVLPALLEPSRMLEYNAQVYSQVCGSNICGSSVSRTCFSKKEKNAVGARPTVSTSEFYFIDLI